MSTNNNIENIISKELLDKVLKMQKRSELRLTAYKAPENENVFHSFYATFFEISLPRFSLKRQSEAKTHSWQKDGF